MVTATAYRLRSRYHCPKLICQCTHICLVYGLATVLAASVKSPSRNVIARRCGEISRRWEWSLGRAGTRRLSKGGAASLPSTCHSRAHADSRHRPWHLVLGLHGVRRAGRGHRPKQPLQAGAAGSRRGGAPHPDRAVTAGRRCGAAYPGEPGRADAPGPDRCRPHGHGTRGQPHRRAAVGRDGRRRPPSDRAGRGGYTSSMVSEPM